MPRAPSPNPEPEPEPEPSGAVDRAGHRAAGAGLLRLYPSAWRRRYGGEMEALLADRPPSLVDRLDLVRGALDAHLHPPQRSVVPGLLAISGGAAWTVAALAIVTLPVLPDWPGYLVDVVPLNGVAIVLLLGAVVGCWLRVGDGGGRFGAIAIETAIAGHLAWLAALLAILAGVDYAASTVIASTAALVGTVLVGLALVRRDDWPMGGLLAVTPVALVLGVGWPWILFGLGWTAIGLVSLRDAARDPGLPIAG